MAQISATIPTNQRTQATPTLYNNVVNDITAIIANSWRAFHVILLDNDTSLSVQDGVGQISLVIPSWMDDYELSGVGAAVAVASSSGTPTIQIHNIDNAVDMLSTRITIDANELTSFTADAAPVIDADNKVVNTGDRIRFDVDVAGTGTKGLVVMLQFTAGA